MLNMLSISKIKLKVK